MAATAIAILKTAWDCKWSRPGDRLTGVPAQFQPETVWICCRTGEREPVVESTCETCAFWEHDNAKDN